MCVSHHLPSHRRISRDGMRGWSCDSDYRGLKKRIMAIKSAQQCGNDLHLTRTISSDSEHESLPSGSGPSRWTGCFKHRENTDGGQGRAVDAQDERQQQQAVMDANGTQVELDELKMRGENIPSVGSVLLSQVCIHHFFKDFLCTRRQPHC
jgi:hypothetical protein